MYMHTVILLPTIVTFCVVATCTELVNIKLLLPGKYGASAHIVINPSIHTLLYVCVSVCVSGLCLCVCFCLKTSCWI